MNKNTIKKTWWWKMLGRHIFAIYRRCCASPLSKYRATYKKIVVGGEIIVCPTNLKGRYSISAISDIATDIALIGCYEPEVTELLSAKCRAIHGDVINIGANIGLLAIHMAKTLNSVGHVYAIEPQPEAFRLLQHNIFQNGCTGKVHAINKCVSKKTEIIKFSYVPGMPEYSSMGGIVHDAVKRHDQESVEIEAMTLVDILIGQSVNPALIVIDVEGAEKLVLEGAHEILTKYHPILIFEVSAPLLAKFEHRASEIVTLLEGIGYKVESAFDGTKIDDQFSGEAIAVFCN